VHVLVPAGGLDRDLGLWRRKDRYLFNERNLAQVFRGKLLTALAATDLSLPPHIPTQWVVDCRHVGHGESALTYLGRYLYRGVLSERDILDCRNDQVRFRYTDAKTGKTQVRTLHGADFLNLLLQHVLPKGFHRTRDYGLLHHKRKHLLRRVQCLLHVRLGPPRKLERPPIRCPHCGAPMRILANSVPSPTLIDRISGDQTAPRPLM
jgi:hypothetical protein